MVLEELIDVQAIREHPLFMLIYAIFVSSVSLWLGFFVFPSSSSVLHVAFVSIASLPLINRAFNREEREEVRHPGSSFGFIQRHSYLIKIYAWFFIGLVLSYSFWYFFLPVGSNNFCAFEGFCFDVPERSASFKEQELTLSDISSLSKSLTTGQATASATGNVVRTDFQPDFFVIFELIFSNNLSVLFLSILFSFVYGAGALFLIGWNASVIAVKVGQFAHEYFTATQNLPMSYFFGLVNALGFLPHGIFEITGFFVGAIAGGIISVAITSKDGGHSFSVIARDTIALIIISVALIFTGALVETYLIVLA